MTPHDSQSPDEFDVKQSIIELSPKISKAARRVYRHPANQDEIEDITLDVIVLLIEDDSRRLRTFASRSKIETWLHTVVTHCVGQYLWKQRWEREDMSLDDLSSDALSYQAIQEKALIDEEEWEALHAIINNLPERKRRLMELTLQGLTSAEIAKEIGIKISSVSSEKSALFKEIRKLLGGR